MKCWVGPYPDRHSCRISVRTTILKISSLDLWGQEAGDLRENRSHVGTEEAWESVLSGQTANASDHSRTFSE